MPTPSRFTHSGPQIHYGELILVRRGHPLPNKGRHSFTDRQDITRGESEEDWKDIILENNPDELTPYNPFIDLHFFLALNANNPIA